MNLVMLSGVSRKQGNQSEILHANIREKARNKNIDFDQLICF